MTNETVPEVVAIVSTTNTNLPPNMSTNFVSVVVSF